MALVAVLAVLHGRAHRGVDAGALYRCRAGGRPTGRPRRRRVATPAPRDASRRKARIVELRRDGEFVVVRVTARSVLLPGVSIAGQADRCHRAERGMSGLGEPDRRRDDGGAGGGHHRGVYLGVGGRRAAPGAGGGRPRGACRGARSGGGRRRGMRRASRSPRRCGPRSRDCAVDGPRRGRHRRGQGWGAAGSGGPGRPPGSAARGYLCASALSGLGFSAVCGGVPRRRVRRSGDRLRRGSAPAATPDRRRCPLRARRD